MNATMFIHSYHPKTDFLEGMGRYHTHYRFQPRLHHNQRQTLLGVFPHIYQFQRFDRYDSMSIHAADVAVDAVDAVVPIASPGVAWVVYTYTNTPKLSERVVTRLSARLFTTLFARPFARGTSPLRGNQHVAGASNM